jgi:hypothetical protein
MFRTGDKADFERMLDDILRSIGSSSICPGRVDEFERYLFRIGVRL